MGGWVDGWMNGRVDGWMGGWVSDTKTIASDCRMGRKATESGTAVGEPSTNEDVTTTH